MWEMTEEDYSYSLFQNASSNANQRCAMDNLVMPVNFEKYKKQT